MIANHPAAGTYYPTNPSARTIVESSPMKIDGRRVSAVVEQDGEYTVFVGGFIVATGYLDGTEGTTNFDRMQFFAAEALVWAAGVDDDRAERAAADVAAYEQHVAETDAVNIPQQREATASEAVTVG